jgi:hypothetical protein
VRTILSTSGPLYCLRGTRGQYSIKRTDLCPPRADVFRSHGPFICYVWTSVPRLRTVFIHRDPEWTFLVTRASCADHSLRERTFSIACVAHADNILVNVQNSARRVRTFFVLADLFIFYVWTSVPRSRTIFIHRTPSRLFWSLALACGPFSPRVDLFLLFGSTRGQFSIKRTDLCPPHADLFRFRGPLICYV